LVPLEFGDIDFSRCTLFRETRLKTILTPCRRGIVKVADPQGFSAHAALVDEMEREAAVQCHFF
jgi:hypothetical protein